ncbi:TolC family protein [Elizabethkingia miricola]|uniref:TolC family protein n=1 Tax=Elizabethkingia miricola TaxID=172045 RepID=UPI00074181A0|nr:TolC family protein [Elizabethkingia miricola]
MKNSNVAKFLGEEANTKAIQTTLVAAIASDYYQLLALDQQLKYTQESVKTWQSTVDVMQKLKTADVVTGAAVVQSEASKFSVAVTIPDLEQSIWETENHLNLLLARSPQPINMDSIVNQTAVPSLETGVPVQLLTNRPDLQVAESNFRYYFE